MIDKFNYLKFNYLLDKIKNLFFKKELTGSLDEGCECLTMDTASFDLSEGAIDIDTYSDHDPKN